MAAATVQRLHGIVSREVAAGESAVLTVGTLSDAPPSICIDSSGQFTGFDNELLRAIAEAKDCRFKDDMRPRLMDMLDEEYRQHGRRFLN